MRRIYLMIPIVLAATLIIGCGKQEEKTTVESGEKATTEIVEQAKSGTVEIDTNVQAEVESKLAEADKLDGTSDKIVHRCASCALGMDGKSEHSLEVMDYTLHFCSGHCKEGFAENVTKSILDLKIPEK